MPKKGFTSITISDEIYAKLQKFIDEYNKKAGFRRFRSVSHLTEEAIAQFIKEQQKNEVSKP